MGAPGSEPEGFAGPMQPHLAEARICVGVKLAKPIAGSGALDAETGGTTFNGNYRCGGLTRFYHRITGKF
jgi:hypothetical protein